MRILLLHLREPPPTHHCPRHVQFNALRRDLNLLDGTALGNVRCHYVPRVSVSSATLVWASGQRVVSRPLIQVGWGRWLWLNVLGGCVRLKQVRVQRRPVSSAANPDAGTPLKQCVERRPRHGREQRDQHLRSSRNEFDQLDLVLGSRSRYPSLPPCADVPAACNVCMYYPAGQRLMCAWWLYFRGGGGARRRRLSRRHNTLVGSSTQLPLLACALCIGSFRSTDESYSSTAFPSMRTPFLPFVW